MRIVMAISLVSALIVACGGDTTLEGTGGTTSTGGTGGTGGGAQGGGGQGGGQGGGGQGGGVSSCDACGPDDFCDFQYHWCEPPPEGEDFPVCTPRPSACPAIDDPVCGCDGTIYGNECEAHAAGIDIGAGTCDASVTPADLFPCGPYFCPATSLCEVGLGDQADRSFSCEPLPMGCDPMAPDCSCLTLNGQQSCEVTPGNGVQGLTVTEVLL